MIIVLFPSEQTPEDHAAAVLAPFAELIHKHVSEIERVDLHRKIEEPAPSLCGDHGTVAETWQGLCPVCASPPVAGVIEPGGTKFGHRHLHCSLCATQWRHVRVR